MVMMKKRSAIMVAIATACLVLAASAEPAARNNPSASYGLFMIDGHKVAMVSKLSGRDCIRPDQPCGALHHCCEGLSCNGWFDGRCHKDPDCTPILGDDCALGSPCCFPMQCTKLTRGGTCYQGSDDLLSGASIKEVVSTAEKY